MCEQAGGWVSQREIRVEPKPAGPPFCRDLSLGVRIGKGRTCVPCPSHPSSASSATCKVRSVQVFAYKRRAPFQVVYAAEADMSTFSLKKGKGKEMISAASSSRTTCQKT